MSYICTCIAKVVRKAYEVWKYITISKKVTSDIIVGSSWTWELCGHGCTLWTIVTLWTNDRGNCSIHTVVTYNRVRMVQYMETCNKDLRIVVNSQ